MQLLQNNAVRSNSAGRVQRVRFLFALSETSVQQGSPNPKFPMDILFAKEECLDLKGN
jgi:hypothetical protein